MKNHYVSPTVGIHLVTVNNTLLTSVTTLSGSSGENIGGKTSYDYDWSDTE